MKTKSFKLLEVFLERMKSVVLKAMNDFPRQP